MNDENLEKEELREVDTKFMDVPKFRNTNKDIYDSVYGTEHFRITREVVKAMSIIDQKEAVKEIDDRVLANELARRLIGRKETLDEVFTSIERAKLTVF